MSWVGLSCEQLADEASDPDLPKWFRVYLLGLSRLTANGHAEFGHGELARILGTNRDTGEHGYDRNVHRHIRMAVEKGRLLPGSTIRCLQVASFRSADGTTVKRDDRCSTCLSVKVKEARRSVTSSGRSLGARSSSVPQEVSLDRVKSEMPLTRNDDAEVPHPVSQTASPGEAVGHETASPGEVVLEPKPRAKLVLVVDDAAPADPAEARRMIGRFFNQHLDQPWSLDDLAAEVKLPVSFVEQNCLKRHEKGSLDRVGKRGSRTYVRTSVAMASGW